MPTRRWILASGAALAVSACTDGMPSVMPIPKDTAPLDLQLTSDGLRVPSTDQRIDFGRAEAGVVAAVAKQLNEQPTSSATNAECGAGPVTTVSFAKGIHLLFQNGDFRGWGATSPVFVTATGLSAGKTRAQLEATGVTGFQQTTIGTEFEVSGVFGLLELPTKTARVDLLWAGVSCFFR